MRIALFEDEGAAKLEPLALTRPVFELVCGHHGLRERLIRNLGVTEWGAFVRDYLVETYREAQVDAKVNETSWLRAAPTLFVNGRWLADASDLRSLDPDTAGVIDGEVVYVTVHPDEAALLPDQDWTEAGIQSVTWLARTRKVVEARGTLIRHPWDLVEHNPRQIAADFAARVAANDSAKPINPADYPQVAFLGSLDDISIAPGASIDPFVVIDARSGPVSVDARAVLQSFTRLEGPCHVGRESQVFRANVRGGTTIGPVCRVGGEIEASILHGYVNKYHDGFLGHGYVCPWSNLGALTSNSDLKNDYSSVKFVVGGDVLDTGSTKVGCFIGDHSKTAIGSLFNTGSNVGVMCCVLPGGELLPKHVPSFTNIWHGKLSDGLPLDRLFAAARTAMNRRNCEFTVAQQKMFRHLFEATRPIRDSALRRAAERVPTGKTVAR